MFSHRAPYRLFGITTLLTYLPATSLMARPPGAVPLRLASPLTLEVVADGPDYVIQQIATASQAADWSPPLKLGSRIHIDAGLLARTDRAGSGRHDR